MTSVAVFSDTAKSLSPEQEKQWRDRGYVVVPGLIEDELIARAKQNVDEIFMDNPSKDFGSEGRCAFPTNTVVDQITLHHNILNSVSQLLKTPQITLTQSEGWCKAGHTNFGAQQNNDQRFHMDYGNNTWLHPTPWYQPENVAVIVYLSDTGVTEGGTAVCPREGDDDELYQPPFTNMPGLAGHWEFYNDKAHAEAYYERSYPEIARFRAKLYERELKPAYKIGDILFYRYDVWHRGTPVKIGHRRSVVSLAFTKRGCFWQQIWNTAWTRKNYYGRNELTFIGLTPRQRSVIGVPEPGHQYWTKEKVRFFEARYPGIDAKPYYDALEDAI